jgi:hypothetical protein
MGWRWSGEGLDLTEKLLWVRSLDRELSNYFLWWPGLSVSDMVSGPGFGSFKATVSLRIVVHCNDCCVRHGKVIG